MLIPKTLICIDKIEHEKKWVISRENIVVEVSAEAREFFEVDTVLPYVVGHNLNNIIPMYHTPETSIKIDKMMNLLSIMEVNEYTEADIEFCLPKGRELIRVKTYKISDTIRLDLFFDKSFSSKSSNASQETIYNGSNFKIIFDEEQSRTINPHYDPL